MRARLAVLGTLAMIGCGPGVSGQVDGERVGGARSAVYDEVDIGFPPFIGVSLLVLIQTDIEDACGSIDELISAGEPGCEDTCSNLIRFREDRLDRDNHWAMFLWARPGDSLVNTYTQSSTADEVGEFDASYSGFDFSSLASQAACEDECSENTDIFTQTDDQAANGVMQITEHEGDLRGEFEIGFGADDELKGSFKAERCDLTRFVQASVLNFF